MLMCAKYLRASACEATYLPLASWNNDVAASNSHAAPERPSIRSSSWFLATLTRRREREREQRTKRRAVQCENDSEETEVDEIWPGFYAAHFACRGTH